MLDIKDKITIISIALISFSEKKLLNGKNLLKKIVKQKY